MREPLTDPDWIVGFVDVLLIIRFLLKLLGGSTVSGFVGFMYDITQFMVAPFHGIFNSAVQGRSILEPECPVSRRRSRLTPGTVAL